MSVNNIGTPQVANRAFVALAIEAGIEPVIRSLTGLATDKRTLLIGLVEALEVSNPPLAAGLNTQTLDAILNYMALDVDAAVLPADRLPELLDEDGPASVFAGRDGGDASQVNFSYNEPPSGYTAEVYLDGVFVKHSTLAATDGTVFDIIQNVAAGSHTVRVLYRRDATDSQPIAVTRFGPVANVT